MFDYISGHFSNGSTELRRGTKRKPARFSGNKRNACKGCQGIKRKACEGSLHPLPEGDIHDPQHFSCSKGPYYFFNLQECTTESSLIYFIASSYHLFP